MSPRQTKRERDAQLLEAARRAAKRVTCRRCGAEVLRGLDGRVMALEATVEVYACTPEQELLARAAGRWSYEVSRHDDRLELDRRDRFSLRYSPRGNGRPIHLQHDCAEHPPENPPPSLFDLEAADRSSWPGVDDLPPF